VIQVVTALGMVQPARLEKKDSKDTETWFFDGLMFYGLMFCVLWAAMTMPWTAVSAVKRWMKGREAAEDNAMRLIPAGGPGLRARVMELTSDTDENYGSGRPKRNLELEPAALAAGLTKTE